MEDRSGIVRAAAIYDVLVTTPFALPGLAEWNLASFAELHEKLGLAGEMPTFSALHMLFVCMFGATEVVWYVVRLRNPRPIYGLYDGLLRVVFAGCMGWYLAAGATQILIGFLVLEVFWAVLQLGDYARRKTRRTG